MKKFFSLVLAAMFFLPTIQAVVKVKSVEGDATATLVWTIGNETEPAVTSDKSDYISQAKVAVGSGLTVGSYTNYLANPGNTMVTYLPANANAGVVPDVMIEYSVKMAKGATFALQSVSYDAIKDGTDNASYSWTYVIDNEESAPVTVSKDDLLRNNNQNASTAQLNHTHEINAAAAQKVALRIYVSGFGNTKKFALSNVQLIGTISGEPEARAFQDFKVEFRDNPYTVILPESGELPAGISIAGTIYNGGQHGIYGGTITVPVDGPVKFTIGACQHSGGVINVQKDGVDFTTVSNVAPCGEQKPNYNQFVTWTYNAEEAATLTFVIPGNVYIPYFFAQACEYIPQVDVKYYDVDGKTLIGKETVEGGSALAYAYGSSDVTVAAGKAFRGWFTSAEPTATKVPAGTLLNEDLSLYARATDIEQATVGAIFDYDLTKGYFYPEDHEILTLNGGAFHDPQHGWLFGNGNSLSVDVAGNALLVVGVCTYSATSTTAVTDAASNPVGQLDVVNKSTADGAEQTIRYEGPATTLTLNFTATNYIHTLKVFNVENLPTKNESTGFYEIAPSDAAAFILTLQTIEAGDKIFLPDGVYDLGERVLTQISKNNISIIGESMEGTIIRNAPDFHNEGIATTATIFIPDNIENTYFQDLTLQNALDYYGALAAGMSSARAVVLQDKGTQTICKNVRLLSYQDTYYSNKQGAVKYFEDCEIHGTVDFICGDGSVYFKNNLLYCEKRNLNGSGSDALTANNGPATDRGYVFDSCTIQSECPVVSLGRAWNNTPTTTFLNTLVDYSAGNFSFSGNGIQRWTLELMNAGAWPLFSEYNTRLEDGTVLTPGNNIVPFIDKKVTPNETRNIETVINADAAANYTIAYTLGNWAATAAADVAQAVCDLTDIDLAGVYLAKTPDGSATLLSGAELIAAQLPDSTLVRKANARGGFGMPVELINEETALNTVTANPSPVTLKILRNGELFILRDGKTYSVTGQQVE